MASKADLFTILQDAVAKYEKKYSCSVVIYMPVLEECFRKVEISLRNLSVYFDAKSDYAPSNFKIAGIVCFWIRKLKPCYVPSTTNNLFVNEIIALLTAFRIVRRYSLAKQKSMLVANKEAFRELVTSLRYNSWSPSSLAFLFESLSL